MGMNFFVNREGLGANRKKLQAPKLCLSDVEVMHWYSGTDSPRYFNKQMVSPFIIYID
jgi:hypothetical protein